MPASQAQALMAMMLLGALLGACFDLLGALGRALALRRVGMGVLDLLFGIVCAAGITATALALRISPLRFYAFAGCVAGMAIYFVSIGTFVRIIHRSLRNHFNIFKITAGKIQN